MNLGELRTRLRLLNPEATSAVVSDANVNLLLNEGAETVANKTDCLVTYDTQDVISGTQEYSLPTDCLKPLYVVYDDDIIPCVTQEWLDQYIPDWRGETGSTELYYRRANYIGLYKEPTANEAGTDLLKIYYVKKPTSMSSDSADPFDSDPTLTPYHNLVVTYARAKCKEIVGKMQQAQLLYSEFEAKCREMKREINYEPDLSEPIRPYYKGAAGKSRKQNPLDQ